MSLRSIYTNRLRAFLSSLGIIIGVSTIVLVIAIWLWAQRAIEEQYANLAVTSLLINPVASASQKSKVSESDVSAIRESATSVAAITAILQWKLLTKTDSAAASTTVLGVMDGFLEISKLTVQHGAYFSDTEIATKSKYVVMWNGAASELFWSAEKAIGQTVYIGKKKMEVLWVFHPSGTSIWPITYDDAAFLAYPMSLSIIGDSGSPRLVALSRNIESIPFSITEIGDLLRKEHKLRAVDSDDFRIVDQWSKVTAAQDSAKTMTLLLTWVALIVLVVSGIGIMNVMFAGVAERIKEIGILKSIGIRMHDIRNLFLYESIILSISGWLVGILLGDLLIPLIEYFDLIDVVPTMIGRLGAFAFAVIVGVFFWFYPAYKASMLDPVDALRA